MRTVSHGSKDPLGFASFTGVTTVVVWLEVEVETARLEPLRGVVQPVLEEVPVSAVVGVGVELMVVLVLAVVVVGVGLMVVLVSSVFRVVVEPGTELVPAVIEVGVDLMVLLLNTYDSEEE